jgi:hypothetical protein
MNSHFEGFFTGVLNCDTHNWFFFPSKSLFQCFEGIQSVKLKIRLLGPLKVYNYIKKSETSIFTLGSTHHPLIEKEAEDQRIPIIQINNTTLRFPIDIYYHTLVENQSHPNTSTKGKHF